ncbi:DUF2651 family protein [Paenibacillus sepulcri]
MIIFPIIFILLGFVGYIVLKNIFIAPTLTFAVSVVLTFTVYNTTFLIWLIIYTLLSFASSMIARLFVYMIQKFKIANK